MILNITGNIHISNYLYKSQIFICKIISIVNNDFAQRQFYQMKTIYS